MVVRAVPTLAVGLLFAALVLVPSVPANHPQPAHGDVVVFDHKTGNEWWVEVMLGGGASGSAAGVQAQDTNGPWLDLAKKSWGAWAASFRIEPGHQVRFRATWSGGEVAESCWFTHPAGVEQCGSTTTSTSSSSSSSSSGGTFDAPFTHFRGNEWWVQARVGTDGSAIAKVDVRIAPDGAWKPLSKQSWGTEPPSWAGSYHFPQGSILQMRATGTDGRTDLSSCRQWIPPSGQDAAIVTCPGGSSSSSSSSSSPSSSTSTGPTPFDATFSNVKGNEWWVEAVVRANKPVQAVFLTIDCAWGHDPHDMSYKREWDKWTLGATHIPSGSVITMEALGDGGSEKSATYLWPQGTIVEDCPPPWPQTGSSAQVRFRDSLREFDGEGGETLTEWDGLIQAEYTDGVGWDGMCEQRVSRKDEDGVWTNTTERHDWFHGPPLAIVPGRVGDTVDIQTAGGGCQLHDFQSTVLGRERRTFSLRSESGDPIEIDAYRAGDSGPGHFSDYWYDARLGLMLDWREHSSSQFHISSSRGWLQDTDAGFR